MLVASLNIQQHIYHSFWFWYVRMMSHLQKRALWDVHWNELPAPYQSGTSKPLYEDRQLAQDRLGLKTDCSFNVSHISTALLFYHFIWTWVVYISQSNDLNLNVLCSETEETFFLWDCEQSCALRYVQQATHYSNTDLKTHIMWLKAN